MQWNATHCWSFEHFSYSIQAYFSSFPFMGVAYSASQWSQNFLKLYSNMLSLLWYRQKFLFFFVIYIFFSGLRLKYWKYLVKSKWCRLFLIRSMHYFFNIWNKTWHLLSFHFHNLLTVKLLEKQFQVQNVLKKDNWSSQFYLIEGIMHWSH